MSNHFSANTTDRVLATDLDGTFIPLAGNPSNRADLAVLSRGLIQNSVTLLFVTGRHFDSVANAMEEFELPRPEWIICDVGTSILARDETGEFNRVEAYGDHLEQLISDLPMDQLRRQLESIEGLRLQEQEKQGRFKLSYYVNADELKRLVTQVRRQIESTAAPYSIIDSVDPFNGDGLIDLLPANVSKAYALEWWCGQTGLASDRIVFAGDSGNDLAALTAGHRAIVVANAGHEVVQHAYDRHTEAEWQNRLFIAQQPATSGVLEGCRWFELVDDAEPTEFRLGATPVTYDRTHFRVWAPKRDTVSVDVVDDSSTSSRRVPLEKDDDGFFTGSVSGLPPRSRYCYKLDGEVSRPDPASRFQPDGVHGPSEIIAPHAFPWTDAGWKGIAKRDLIIYELHVGAFTEAGTFRSAIERLPELIELGVTAVELMPVAQSPGRWNWGYDGVDLFAVSQNYGEPDDFKAFVDACHASGLAVVLDVVYNHVGPEGNYLAEFGPYFSEEHGTPWGEAFNFDGPHAENVRQFIIENSLRWLDEYHLDGLRLDAVHFMYDNGDDHILADIRRAVTKYASTIDRIIHLIAESNVFDPELLDARENKLAYDAAWSDCLMHSIYSHAVPDLKLTDRQYRGANDLAEVLQHGFLYSYGGQKTERVTDEGRRDLLRGETRAPIGSFVTALQTHDGVGNHPFGHRLHHLTSKAFQKAASALTLLYPSVAMIFMGEEFASDAPFPFFVDFEDASLRQAVDAGRANEYPQHEWDGALSPSDPQAYFSAKCYPETGFDKEMWAWYRDLIELRKQGQADGWLSASRLTAAHDPTHDLFTLRFALENEVEITIMSRLGNADSQSADPLEVKNSGRLLLSSEPVDQSQTGCLLLGPNHAIICETR